MIKLTYTIFSLVEFYMIRIHNLNGKQSIERIFIRKSTEKWIFTNQT